MELMQTCVPEEHAQEATMQHQDMLIEMVPESSLPDNLMPTPLATPRVPVINVPMEAPRALSLRPTCLVPLDQQTKRQRRSYQKGIVRQWPRIQIFLSKHTREAYVIPELNYSLVWQDICKEEPLEEFMRFAVVCATEREYLTASDLWDQSVREGEHLVIEIMEQASIELMTSFTRVTDFFRFDAIAVMLTDLCAATEAGRGSLAHFSATLYQNVKIL